ncbi:MAG: sialate O-acetylesterase [Opitutaceae bacterium]|jgi:sialate O-acetylesterase
MSLTLASPFQNNAILQRDQLLPVWGWTTPNSTVRVSLGGHTARALGNALGEFFVRLPAMPAGGPHTLTVTVAETNERWEATNILIGEVWIASGQSNMEMRLNACLPLTAEVIATADFPQIRFFNVPCRANLGPQRTIEGSWQAATPAAVPPFSAAAFIFARRLHRELGVPVGIVSTSWGGSLIQSWMSRSALALNPEASDWLAQYENKVWSEKRWEEMLSAGPGGRVSNMPLDPGNSGAPQGWHLPSLDDSGWAKMKLPSTWQSAGHLHTGVFWFRRTVEIPAAWVGRELTLHLGAVDKQDISYVNGVEVGRMGKDREDSYWNIPRHYPIPASAVTGRTLVIAVRAYSFVYDGGIIGADKDLRLSVAGDPESSLPLAGDWRYHLEHNLGIVNEDHVMGHGERNSPHILFDNMLLPFIPYAVRGAIWYQGEGNASKAALYASLMRDLVLDWRRHWGQPDFAFHLVQLPNFQAAKEHQPDSNWARLRESQTAALALPHVGMAVTIDVGDPGDIHPKNKVPVGERLATSALARTYGRDLIPNGPIFNTLTIGADGSARCRFHQAGKGLTTTDGQPPRLFFIAGDDRVFHSAKTRIEGTEVVVSHPAVPRPCAVRYAWADNPEGCNLAGPTGLPAGPFRSDRW